MLKKTSAIAVMILAIFMGGCTKETDRSTFPREEFVTVYYCAGFNNLSSSIQKNIDVLKKGELPFDGSKHKMLVFSHFSKSDSNFKDLTESHLIQYTKTFGILKADTLLTIDQSRYATDPAVLNEVLSKVQELFPSAHYGMVVSSHGTGWLPAGKYSTGNVIQMSKRKKVAGDLPLYRYNEDPGSPKVKTFGAEVTVLDGKNYSIEMTAQSMAAAIPIHLDYILFDACLMGGVEVAYEFKDVADKIAFSPTEVLATGFDYSDISFLLADQTDIDGFCKRYFDYYDSQSGSMQSATISVVRSSALPALAGICKTLFGKYRSEIAALGTGSGIQRYFRANYHWFFDLEDILVKAGISADEKAALEKALADCISYKAATPQFLGIEIKNYSGLSMYLPGAGDSELNVFYRTLAWNKAANLVE